MFRRCFYLIGLSGVSFYSRTKQRLSRLRLFMVLQNPYKKLLGQGLYWTTASSFQIFSNSLIIQPFDAIKSRPWQHRKTTHIKICLPLWKFQLIYCCTCCFQSLSKSTLFYHSMLPSWSLIIGKLSLTGIVVHVRKLSETKWNKRSNDIRVPLK